MLSGNFRERGVCGTSSVTGVWVSSIIQYTIGGMHRFVA
jgi:hypothetical protein